MKWKFLLTGLALLLLTVSTTIVTAETWGYDLPYSYAYGAGVPFYVGHNNGAPSGNIYEYPAQSEPGMISGQPENAMDLNFSHAYPSMASLTYGGQFSPFTFVNL